MTFPPVIEGKSCIIADQSGSGKTLAYLAPIIQCLREEEMQELSKSSSQNPRVVVMVPTAELASQVCCCCAQLISAHCFAVSLLHVFLHFAIFDF